jgi:hypothetical protein
MNASSFAEVEGSLECKDQVVTRVEVKLTCGGVKGELSVPSPDLSKKLSIVTFPEGSEPAKELFVRMRIWADEHRPDWLRGLNGLPPFIYFILVGVIGLCLCLIAATYISVTAGPSWRDEARGLVDKGVSQEDQGRALELLLRRELEPQAAARIPPPFWLCCSLVTLAVMAALLCISASTAFEIGKGAASVRWQKWYAGFLRKTLPGFLFMGVLASTLGSFLYEYLKQR